MKQRVKKYLSSKERKEYSNLDLILEMYLNGEIKKILSQYDGIGIYPTFRKKEKTIQITYNFCNIYISIDFFEDKYSVVIYYSGVKANDLDKLFIDYNYPEHFNLKLLIKEIDIKIKTHPKLKDITLLKKKVKKYSIISWISLYLPIVIFGGIGLYCVITGETIKGNMWWGIFFMVFPLIIWFIFDVKSERIK